MLMTASDFLDLAANAQAQRIVEIRRRSGQPLSDQTAADLSQALQALAHARSSGSICANANTLNTPLAVAHLLSDRIARESDATFDRSHPSVLVIDRDDECTRIYDESGFASELALARKLIRMAQTPTTGLAPSSNCAQQTEQDKAIDLACSKRLAIITGGPGTGKTTTVVRILQALLTQTPDLNIVLAAPTGKAAGRMKQAVYARSRGEENPDIRSRLEQLQSCTLHRLLTTPAAGAHRPDQEHPLECDVLVVDESSMIDNDLACALFAAIDPERTRVILLGDRFQLAAVGPGSIYADLCKKDGALAAHIAELSVSHRFDSNKAIGKLSSYINSGRHRETLALLQNLDEHPAFDDNRIIWEQSRVTKPSLLTAAARKWAQTMADTLVAAVRRLSAQITDPALREQALTDLAKTYARFGALAATREGPMSVAAINDAIDAAFVAAGLPAPFWRQIVVRHNDPSLGIYNGDVGIVVPSLSGDAPEVYFGDTARTLRYALLPPHDMAFAITIHQSQGSEYACVGVFLSPNAFSSINTRELLYTAVTRVKDEWDLAGPVRGTLTIFATPKAVTHAVLTPTERLSGLAKRLKQQNN